MADDQYPADFFYTNEWIYHLAGIWLYNPPNIGVLRKIWEVTWSVFVYASAGYFLYLEFLIFRETVHDIKKFLSQFGMLLTHVLGIVRVCLLLSRHQRLLKLQSALQDKEFCYESWGQFVPGKFLTDAKTFSSRLSILVCYFSFKI